MVPDRFGSGITSLVSERACHKKELGLARRGTLSIYDFPRPHTTRKILQSEVGDTDGADKGDGGGGMNV